MNNQKVSYARRTFIMLLLTFFVLGVFAVALVSAETIVLTGKANSQEISKKTDVSVSAVLKKPLGQSNSLWESLGTNIFNTNKGNVGIGVSNPSAKLQVVDGAVLFNGSVGSTPTSGSGTRFMWIPAKGALRAGTVTGAQWDDADIGKESIGLGRDTVASGDTSIAIGSNVISSGQYSIAIGSNFGQETTLASNFLAVAIGSEASATSLGSIAVGTGASSRGWSSLSIGTFTNSNNLLSTVVGSYANATGAYSFVFGNELAATASRSFAVGTGFTNNIPSSLMIGFGTQPTVFVDSTSVGVGTTTPRGKLTVRDGTVLFDGAMGNTPVSGAGTRFMWIPEKAALRAGEVLSNKWDDTNIGFNSIALGFEVEASGDNSVSLGSHSNAQGTESIALGAGNSASGQQSAALGYVASATGDFSTAIGRYVHVSGNEAIVIGAVSPPNVLTNNIPNSLMIGFSSTPTLFVNGSSVGIGTTTPAATLDIAGFLRVLPLLEVPACSAGTEGAIYYDKAEKVHKGCDGSVWHPLYSKTISGGAFPVSAPVAVGTVSSGKDENRK